MALVIADRVKETTTTIGTGALALNGAYSGLFVTFGSVMAVGDTCYYAIEDATNSAWEIGLGTYSAASTLTRTTVLASSNAGAAVNFAAGTKQVWLDLAASQVKGFNLPAQPFIPISFYPGVPPAGALMLMFAVPAGISTLTFAAALAGSSGKALVAATAQTDFDIRKNATTSASGTTVGTMRFAAGSTVPTFIASSGFTLTGGTDWLTMWAPAAPDATLANVSGSLYCTR